MLLRLPVSYLRSFRFHQETLFLTTAKEKGGHPVATYECCFVLSSFCVLKKQLIFMHRKKNLKRSILLRTTTILTTMRMATATTTMTAASTTKEVSSGRSHNPQGGIRHLNTNGENKASSEKKRITPRSSSLAGFSGGNIRMMMVSIFSELRYLTLEPHS